MADELEPRQARLRGGGRIGPHHGELEPLRAQPHQAALERSGRGGVHLQAHDAGELAGQAREAALHPVRAVSPSAGRHRAHQAGTIRADQGKDQGSLHAWSPSGPDARTPRVPLRGIKGDPREA